MKKPAKKLTGRLLKKPAKKLTKRLIEEACKEAYADSLEETRKSGGSRFFPQTVHGSRKTPGYADFLSSRLILSLITNCGELFRDIYMRPTYSPISPSINMIMPVEKSRTAMVEL